MSFEAGVAQRLFAVWGLPVHPRQVVSAAYKATQPRVAVATLALKA